MGKEDTPLPFCFTCNKVINLDNAILHLGHNTGKKSWRQMYDEAIHDTGGNK